MAVAAVHLAAAAVMALGMSAIAQSELPQPRVSYAMHSARINQIRATPDFQRLVTVGQDKTVRVWRLSDMRLLRVIHVPSEAGEEGALRSLAVTHDGREVIVGGWTGIAWGGMGQLYRFDLNTGRLLQTLRGFPEMVESLVLSHDGRRLAVGLGGGAGLRVLDLPTGRELAADLEYGERVTFADFSREGVLATTSADGCLRLYDLQHRLTFRTEYPPRNDGGSACRGSELGGVRFSPDGTKLAFGMQDKVELVVMDVASRNLLRRYSVDDPLQRSLCCPNWSTDGQLLHMHGANAGSGPTPLYRVNVAGGAIERMEIGRQRFTNVLPLPNGDMVFSTTAPALARFTFNGSRVAETLPPNGDFRFEWARFHVSEDGQRVSIPMRADGGEVRYFDIAGNPETAYRAATAADIAATKAPLHGEGVQVDAVLDDFGYKQPVRINGNQMRLKAYQSVRSWAAAPAGQRVALGTQWSVLLADARGQILWERDLPAPAYQVSISGDGRWVVAVVGDGTLRWYDLSGNERLGLFLHADGEQWVAWRPDGYYASSPQGDAFFGWLVNRGDTQAPDFFRAVQFERELYRPDLVRAALTEPALGAGAGEQLAATLRRFAAPRVTIESIQAGNTPDTLAIRFNVEPTGRPVRELGVYVDGIPLLTAAERGVGEGGGAPLTRTVMARAVSSNPVVRVEAESDSALGFDESMPVESSRSSGTASLGRLWVVAAGVHKFDQIPDLQQLPSATNDAVELARALQAQQGKAFSEVKTVVLTEASVDKPTKANILARLRELDQMRPEDTLVVFLASHGTTDASEYYFVTKDSDKADLSKLTNAMDNKKSLPAGSVPSLLTASELTAALRRLPGRRILMLDTCQSGAAGNSDPYSLVKRSMSAQLAVVSAARGDESSYDSPTRPNGAFTIAIVDALTGRLNMPKGPVTLRGVFDAATPEVQEAVRQLQNRSRSVAQRATIKQTPTLSAPKVLENSVLAHH